MNIDRERASFEAWYRLHHGSRNVYERDTSGEYADKQVQGAFNVWLAQAALTAQQQPTEGEEIMVNTPHGVFTLPLHPSGLSSGPRFVVHVPEIQREQAETQSEALRLADHLERFRSFPDDLAAAELRRLQLCNIKQL